MYVGFSSQQEPVEAAAPPGPPQFALSDDESIQKFRDSLSSRFAPESSRPSNRDSVRGSSGYKLFIDIILATFKIRCRVEFRIC